MTKLALLHTTPATLDPLKALAAELLPGCEVVNFVDDSILPQLAQTGGDLSAVRERMLAYTRFAEQVGANAILEACSSVGELVPEMRAAVSVPVVRIDEAMAEAVIMRSGRIGVAATLGTTLDPTVRLLQAKAQAASRSVTVTPLLIPGAFEKLKQGDKAGHDAALIAALSDLAPRVDVVVLAQASMARVVPQLPEAEQNKFFSSPRLAMLRVKQVLEGVTA